MFNHDQIVLIIPRLLQAAILLIVALILLKQAKKSQEVAPVQKIFSGLFIIAAFSFILEILFNLVAGLSFTEEYIQSIEEFPRVYLGYDWEYPSVAIANIFRDIYGISEILIGYYAYMGAVAIKYGSEAGKKRATSLPVLAFYGTITILFTIFDGLLITIETPELLIIDPDFGLIVPEIITSILYVVFILSFLYSLGIVFSTYRDIRHEVTASVKRKFFFFILGYVFLIAGHFYWLLAVFFEPMGFSSFVVYMIVGQSIWAVSAIMFLFAFAFADSNPPQKDSN